MTQCYNCSEIISDSNSSVEHVIPNAVGGRLKSSALLCKSCNSLYGGGIDAVFAHAMEPIAALLNIKRERKKENILKNLTNEIGEQFHLIDGRIPVATKPTIRQEENKIHIMASDMRQLKQIVNGLKRKFPNLDTSNIFENAKTSKKFLESELEFSLTVGGEEYHRAIGKIAVNAYLHFGGQVGQIYPFIDVVKGNQANDFHIHSTSFCDSHDWKPNQINHSIHIHGCQKRKILYGYLVFFSAFAFVVNLSDDYQGDEINISYCYDVLESTTDDNVATIAYSGRLSYAREVSENAVTMNQTIIKSIEANLTRVIRVADGRHIDTTIDEIMAAAMREVLDEYPEDAIFTESMLQELTEHAAEAIAPFLHHLHRRKEA